MQVNKLKQWTKEEDDILKREFYKIKSNKLYNRWNKGHDLIKKALEDQGIMRTVKAVSRRLNRLGLKFYEVNEGLIYKNCVDCHKKYLVSDRYLKSKYCLNCRAVHRYDWEKRNRPQVLKYYRDYYKINKKGGTKT